MARQVNRSPRCNFHVQQLHRGVDGGGGYVPKCLLLISAGRKSRLQRESGGTCQNKPAETRWGQLTVYWNSSDIGTWLATQPLFFNSEDFFLQNLRLELTHHRYCGSQLSYWYSMKFVLVSFCSVSPANKYFRLTLCQSLLALNAGYGAVRSYFTALLSNELK